MTTIGSDNAPNLPEIRMTAKGKTTFPEDGTASAPAGSRNADNLPAKKQNAEREKAQTFSLSAFSEKNET